MRGSGRLVFLVRARPWAAATILLLLTACGEFRPTGSDYHYLRHKVQPGETLYSIAFRYGHDYQEVAAWNGIWPPYRIRAGEELLILKAETEVDEPPPKAKGSAARPPKGAAAPAKVTKPSKPPRTEPARTASRIKWSWPTEGKLVKGFAAGAGRKGLDLGGKLGQPVKAAAEGDVVYSGNGLIGYGNLIIIKHDEVFLSAYGHNRKLLVKEGDKVKAGQTIGEMGQHPKSGSILHFEIRRNGKPVDPLLYLPNQNS